LETKPLHRLFPLVMILLIGLSGCYKNNELQVIKPLDLIPKDQMVQIFTDMQLIEATVEYDRMHGSDNKLMEKHYYQVLFQHYHVNARQIRRNLDYYNSREELMESVYGGVLAKLSKQQAVLNLEKTLREAIEQSKLREKEFQRFQMGRSYREDSIAHLYIKPVF